VATQFQLTNISYHIYITSNFAFGVGLCGSAQIEIIYVNFYPFGLFKLGIKITNTTTGNEEFSVVIS
jgi:hypothetical protein